MRTARSPGRDRPGLGSRPADLRIYSPMTLIMSDEAAAEPLASAPCRPARVPRLCGLIQTIPPLGHNAARPVCHPLRHHAPPHPLAIRKNRALALTLTSLVLYLVAIFMRRSSPCRPDRASNEQTTILSPCRRPSSPTGAWELAAVVTADGDRHATAAKIGVMLLVLIGLQPGSTRRPACPGSSAGTSGSRPWAMVEVFLLGVFVAYTRLGSIARVETGDRPVRRRRADDHHGPGRHRARQRFRVGADGGARVWFQRLQPGGAAAGYLIGCDECGRVNHAPAPAWPAPAAAPRCGSAPLRTAMRRTWALLITAPRLLYIPANVLSPS